MKAAMIEDDAEFAEILKEYLKKFDIELVNFEDEFIGLSAIEIEKFDVLILDLMLTSMDGLELLKKIRKRSSIPILISSARGDLEDKIVGLELRADDYLPKPYNPRELVARLKALCRRKNKKTEEFKIDEEAKEIIYNQRPLRLTGGEYKILSLFLRNPNKLFSKEDIAKKCNLSDSTKTIEVLISKIHQKIGKKYIVSVRKEGYKLVL